MRLRICDGQRERTAPASFELIEEAFTPVVISDGYEVALADGDRWIAAVAVTSPESGDPEFLLSGADPGMDAGRPISRSEAVRRFREFVTA